MFRSDAPSRKGRCGIRDHAEDAREVLTAAGYESADVILGHSQGVQVALEFAAIFPDAVQAMVLLNGSHGQVR